MYKTKERGFTLVELIVVIVVLGILAAIGIPRYNNYVNESRLAHIKADMKTISGLIEVTAMEDDGIYKGDSFDDLSELEKAISEGRVYKEGNLLLQEDYAGGDFHVIKELFIKSNARSKLKGTFLVDGSDNVYYVANKKLKGNNKPIEPGDDSGNSDGKWRFTNIEPGVVNSYLATATNGIDEKYLMFDEFSFHNESSIYFEDDDSWISYYDGWKELTISQDTVVQNIKQIKNGLILLKDGRIYENSNGFYLLIPNNVRITELYTDRNFDNIFEDIDGNLIYGMDTLLKKSEFKEHLQGSYILDNDNKLYQTNLDWENGLLLQEIDNNVSRIVAGIRANENIVYQKDDKLYISDGHISSIFSEDTQVSFIPTEFSDYLIDNDNNVYLDEGVVKWLNETKEVINIDGNKYLTITKNNVYESVYTGGKVDHKEVVSIEHGDVFGIFTESNTLSIAHKDNDRIVITGISTIGVTEVYETEDITKYYTLPGIEFYKDDLIDKKPILYSEKTYKIEDTLYFIDSKQEIHKLEGYDYISPTDVGIYLKDSHNVIHYLDDRGTMNKVNNVDKDTHEIISNIRDLQQATEVNLLADGEAYRIDCSGSSYLNITKVNNETGHKITELVPYRFAKLDNNQYMEIYYEDLIEIKNQEEIEYIEGLRSNEELISKLSKANIEHDLRPHFDMVYKINQFPKEVNPNTVKIHQNLYGQYFIPIIDNGSIWITGYRFYSIGYR